MLSNDVIDLRVESSAFSNEPEATRSSSGILMFGVLGPWVGSWAAAVASADDAVAEEEASAADMRGADGVIEGAAAGDAGAAGARASAGDVPDAVADKVFVVAASRDAAS